MNRIITVLLLTFLISPANVFSQEWTQTGSIPHGSGVTDMAVLNDGTLIVTTASHNWPSGQQGGIRRSTDEGNTWHNVLNAYNARTLYAGPSGKIFASCWLYPQNEGMFFSTDGGLNWEQNFFGAANDNVFSIAAKNGDSMVFIGTRNGVYRNFNNGSWIQLMTGMPVNSWVRDIAIDSTGVIAAATTNGVFISTNHGNQWVSCTGLPSGDTIVSLCFGKETELLSSTERKVLYAGSDDGKVLKSFRDNETYAALFLANVFWGSNEEVHIFGINNAGSLGEATVVLAARYPRLPEAKGGVSVSTTGGTSFTNISNGLPSPAKVSKTISGQTTRSEQTIYCGLYNGTAGGAVVYKSVLNTAVNQISNIVPDEFDMQQNYPNPFNPSTKINFSINSKERVTLKIYDVTGKEIETLVDKILSEGEYSADWNGSNYNSGVYVCRLSSDNFSKSIKMILTK